MCCVCSDTHSPGRQAAVCLLQLWRSISRRAREVCFVCVVRQCSQHYLKWMLTVAVAVWCSSVGCCWPSLAVLCSQHRKHKQLITVVITLVF